MSNRTYDFVKGLITLGLPGLGAFYFTLANIWDLPFAEPVTGTITALCVALGVLLRMASNRYEPEPPPLPEKPLEDFDGVLDLVKPAGQPQQYLLGLTEEQAAAMADKPQIVLKVNVH